MKNKAVNKTLLIYYMKYTFLFDIGVLHMHKRKHVMEIRLTW